MFFVSKGKKLSSAIFFSNCICSGALRMKEKVGVSNSSRKWMRFSQRGGMLCLNKTKIFSPSFLVFKTTIGCTLNCKSYVSSPNFANTVKI